MDQRKKILSVLILLFIYFHGDAQKSFNDSIADSRNHITKTAMTVLGGWAAANIISGFIIEGQTKGEAKYFWQMNAYWNLVNGGLAVMGWLGAKKAMMMKYGYAENEAAQQSLIKIYAFNFGLDLAYIATGLYLHEKGNNEDTQKSRDQFSGYGTSIIVQGSFLLIMDGIIIGLHQKNSNRLNKKLKNLELNAGPNGLGLVYHF
jgi:hypothetical protein